MTNSDAQLFILLMLRLYIKDNLNNASFSNFFAWSKRSLAKYENIRVLKRHISLSVFIVVTGFKK